MDSSDLNLDNLNIDDNNGIPPISLLSFMDNILLTWLGLQSSGCPYETVSDGQDWD